MSVILCLVVTCVVLLLTYSLQYRWSDKRYWQLIKKFPSGMNIPFLGNAHMFIGDPEKILDSISRLWEYHKMKNFRIMLAGEPFLIICEPDAMEAILSNNKEINKAKDYQMMQQWLGNGLLLSTGNLWRSRRKILTPAFHFKILEKFVLVFNEEGDILIDKLKECTGKILNIYRKITFAALDVICESSMGTTVNAQSTESDYVKAVYRISELIHTRSFSFWKRNLFLYKLTSDYKEQLKMLEILHGMTDKVIKSRKLQLKDKIEKSESFENEVGERKKAAFLDLLLLTKTADGKNLSDQSVREEVDTFMFEGHDTTSSCISFLIYAFSKYPEIQELAYQEQLSIMGDDRTKRTTSTDLQYMNYLERCIKESLRLYPPVPLIGRLNKDDIPLPDGRIIPPGTNLHLQIFTMHRNPNYFPDPLKFNPDRFLPENTVKMHPFAFVPFSAGSRNCIGQKFAMFEIKATLSKILRNFKINDAGPDYEPILSAELILKSKNGIHVILEER